MGFTSGSPTGAQLEIGIALVLQDRFSNQAREASSEIRRLHMDAKNAVAANAQTMQGIALTGLALATGMGRGLKNIVTEGAEFIDMMTTVRVITEASEEQLKILSDTAQTLGVKTMFASAEIASGMKYLAMAGVQAKGINEMITGAAFVAGATGMELGGKGGTADMITNVMRTFKITAAEAATVVGDQLAKAALSSNVSMIDMAESIRYAAADMVTLKQQLPQVAAMIGTLGNAGIQGSMAGTALSNMARYFNKAISDPNYKGNKILKSLGFSKQDFIDAKGDLIDFSMVLQKIQLATANMTSTDRNAALLGIFGVRGNRAAVAMMNNLEGYRELLGKVTNESKGFAENVVGKRMETIAGSLDILTSSLENVRTTFTQSLAPFLSPIIRVLGTVAGWLREVFAIPVLGTIISSLMTMGVALLGISSAIVFLRSRWLIFKNDSMVSGRSMFSLLTMGWNAATIKAERYLAIEAAIIAQRRAGIVGNVAGAVMSTGVPVGGVIMQTTKRGAQVFKSAKTGRFVSAAAGKAAMASSTAGSLAGSVVGGAVAGATVKGIAKTGIGRGLAMVGGRLLGLLGGPWGLVITAAVTLIPIAINAIRGNKKSVDSNTEAHNNLTGAIKDDIASRNLNKDGTQLSVVEEMRVLVNSLEYWAGKISGKPAANLVINIDGKQAMVQAIKDHEASVNVNMNTK